MTVTDPILNIFNNAPADAIVRLDKDTWVRRSAVSMVRMGPKQETYIFLAGVANGLEVNSSITEVLKALGSEDDS